MLSFLEDMQTRINMKVVKYWVRHSGANRLNLWSSGTVNLSNSKQLTAKVMRSHKFEF